MAGSDFDQLRQIYETARTNAVSCADSVKSERRKLYIASLTTIAVYVTGAIPTQIEPLGVDLSQLEVRSVQLLLSLIVIYFLIQFALAVIEEKGARSNVRLTADQMNEAGGYVTGKEWFRLTSYKENKWLKLGDFAKAATNVLNTVVPIFVGIVAGFIGFFPATMSWLKLLAPASAPSA